MGYDIFDTKDWNYTEPSTFSNVGDLVNVAVDPKDENHIYISSWRGGVVELQDNEKVETWVEENTNNHIQKLYYAPDPNYVSIRIGGSIFDDDGNLWVANGWNVDRPFVVRMANGEWNSFALNNIRIGDDNGMSCITIDENGNKWIGTRDNGIWIYNEGESFDSTGDDKMLSFTKSPNSGNLPDIRVNTVAIDKNNVAWIGTELGLVVFSDVEEMFDLSYFAAEPIIINEDGVGKKLLGNQTINKIVVDGANNKWIATESGGVYYVSANGQKTIHHFTKDNSPLPSDHVFDLDVDPETGRVYFVTSKGLVSFIGNATEGGDDFSKVFAYPNPVSPGYDGDIYIKGLTDKTNVKITDINGNLIFETTSQGGQAVWNGRSLSGYKASSGVYLVFAVSKDGTDTTVTKILIVN
jgi:ligand-binding sensor domain-containing protein